MDISTYYYLVSRKNTTIHNLYSSVLERPSHQDSPWFLSPTSWHKSRWASGILAGSRLNLSLLESVLILISSPLCIIGTQTSKAYPFHPKPKKFLVGKNINSQCRSGNGFWFSGWNESKGSVSVGNGSLGNAQVPPLWLPPTCFFWAFEFVQGNSTLYPTIKTLHPLQHTCLSITWDWTISCSSLFLIG